MKKWTSCASGVLLAALALHMGGCDAGWGGSETPSLETRTFALHHIEASEAANLIGPYIYAERAGAPGMVSEAQDDSPAITVRETADNLDRIAAVLAEFDRSQRPYAGTQVSAHLAQRLGAGPRDFGCRH